MFNAQDPANQDRLAMVEVGARMIAQHPLTGVGPNMQRDSREPIALGVRPHYNVVRFEVDQDFQTNFIESIWQHDANDISPGA